MYEPQFASHAPGIGSIDISSPVIIVDAEDFEGIHIAVNALAADFERVTGNTTPFVSSHSGAKDIRGTFVPDVSKLSHKSAIIIGSKDRSHIIQSIVKGGKLDTAAIDGQWECYVTKLIDNPLEGFSKALVIAGSDKRGTIYGTYSLSEQIGVSPWYWWADILPKQSKEIYALDVTTKYGPPAVKYRGIFLNDEAPALAGWVHEKFGEHFNVEFYKKVFELLLRLKANFLWPAMWFGFPHPGNSFFTDDPLNQQTADQYGIVMSTSHHEPMQRAMNEWFDRPYFEPEGSWSWIKNKDKITKYFEQGAQRAMGHESYFTMGMRGDGDREMDVDDPPSVVREILSTQRAIMKETYGKEDAVPQLMALYKEVQEYYEGGLQIPEDITLLFADDNFGTVRRLPCGEEPKRRGRAGIYYHLEYVGEPRSYKWLNSNSLAKIWQQLEYSYARGADQIWVFNVGDLKPLEIPLTFAMNLAWEVKSLEMSKLQSFFHAFVERAFELDATASTTCSELLLKYDRLVALRKHEHIEPETFSIVNYGEADRIVQEWRDLLDQAKVLENACLEDQKPSYFQLILHPIKATYIYIALRVAQAKNRLYALQRRNSSNAMAYEALRLFEEDFELSEEYHKQLEGKWNHMMSQPHYGYRETWHAPSRDMISGLSFVQTRQNSNAISGWIGIAVEGHPGVRPGLVNEESDRTHPTRRDRVPGVTLPPMELFGPTSRCFEIYSIGGRSLSWTVTSPEPWLTVSPASGDIEPKDADTRVTVSINWKNVPPNFNSEVLLDLKTTLGDYEQIHLPVVHRELSADVMGFVESDGHVSVNATSFTNASLQAYRILPFIGRTSTGGIALVARAETTHSEFLEYPFVTFTQNESATLVLEFTFTLDTDPNAPITYQLQIDDGPTFAHRLIPEPEAPGKLPDGWYQSVMDNVWSRRHPIDMSEAGQHSIKIRLGSENCVLEKIVVDLGGVRESYLGPPQSFYHSQN